MASTTEEKKVKIIADGKQAEASINQIAKAYALLNRERNKEKAGSDRFKELSKDLADMNRRLTTARNEIKALDNASGKFGSNFKNIIAGVVGGNLITSALGTLKNFASKALDYQLKLSDAYADIRKVTGLTQDSIKELDSIITSFDTRTPVEELRELAVEAGKLGIEGVQNIAKFVKEADQIKVALGQDLGPEAITQIGRLSQIFKVSMLEIGSAINEIGAQSAATEAYQVDFLNRMAGTGPTAKIAAQELLGYSATLENMGQSAEVSGTAMSKFFIDFIKDVEKFGAIAGMQKGQISEIFNSKGTNAAFMAFLENLKKTKNGSVELAKSLDEMGIDGARSTGVFLALANNTEEVAKQQAIANKAIQDGTSLTNEFNVKNQTLAATFEKFKKFLNETFMNSSLVKGISRLTAGLLDLVMGTDDANEQFAKMILNEKNMQIAMNNSLDTLKYSNLSQESRSILIKEINEKYGEYLPNLLDEKSTIEDITKAQNEANKAFEKKILLQIYEKELAEATQKLVEAEKNVAISQIAKGKAGQDAYSDLRNRAGFVKKLADDTNKLDDFNKKSVESAKKNIQDIKELYKTMSENLFGEDTAPGNKGIPNPIGGGSGKADDKDSQKALDKKKRDLETAEQMVLEYERNITLLKINSDYERSQKEVELEYEEEVRKIKALEISQTKKDELILLAQQSRDEKLLELEEARIAKEELLKEKQLEKDAKMQEKADDTAEKNEEEHQKRLKEIRKDAQKALTNELRVQAFNFLQQEQSEKYNRMLSELDKQKELELSNANLTQEEKQKINQTYDDKRRAILNEQARKEKELALFRIAVDTAVSAVSALKTDPTGVLSALIIAQGIAQGAVVAAKEVPQFYSGGKTLVKGSDDGNIYRANNVGSIAGGGVYSNPSLGLVGEKGAELVIPNWLYSSPAMANTMSTLESMIYNTKAFATGGSTSPGVSAMPDNSEMIAIMKMNTAVMANLNEQISKGFIGRINWGQSEQTEFEKFTNRREKVKSLSEL